VQQLQGGQAGQLCAGDLGMEGALHRSASCRRPKRGANTCGGGGGRGGRRLDLDRLVAAAHHQLVRRGVARQGHGPEHPRALLGRLVLLVGHPEVAWRRPGPAPVPPAKTLGRGAASGLCLSCASCAASNSASISPMARDTSPELKCALGRPGAGCVRGVLGGGTRSLRVHVLDGQGGAGPGGGWPAPGGGASGLQGTRWARTQTHT
jgi:hypothetical protein